MCVKSNRAVWYTGLLLLASIARASRARAESDASGNTSDDVEWRVTVSAVSPDASAVGGEALARLAAAELGARGVPARVAAPPRACAAPDRDGPDCLEAVLAALARGELDAAVLPALATGAPASPWLRDHGLEELGDAAPPARRACLAAGGSLRSLLDLADRDRARPYRISMDDLVLLSRLPCLNGDCWNETYTPELCRSDKNTTCATILTGDKSELKVLSRVVREHGLLTRVIALGARLPAAAATLGARNIIVCDRAPDYTELARLPTRTLGPPPCRPHCDTGRCRIHPCPFEPHRLLKLVNARSLTRSATALRVLTRLRLKTNELRELIIRARLDGPVVAADSYLDSHNQTTPLGQVRTVVMIPVNTSREAFDARALVAAATLAEEDLLEAGLPRTATFKAELSDDGCAAPHAYKYLTNAPGSGEYGALSAVVGPACGAPWADAARLSPAHVLPVLAYSAQTALPPSASLALLAAGDARDWSAAWGSLLVHFGWRRLAVLSEPATRAGFDPAALQADVVVHVELSENAENQSDLITRWIDRVKAANARILYVNLEDARAVRAALCAARSAGLTGADSGAVWLLPGAPLATWLRPGAGDSPACSAEQLAEAAEGHLCFAPEWMVEWRDDQGQQIVASDSTELDVRRAHWQHDWRDRCKRGAGGAGGAACGAVDPHAALLYDVLRLWAAALDRLLFANPSALDDLHQPDLVRSLIENVTSMEYVGLTGRFEWSSEKGAHARVSPLLLQQWNNGTRRRVARWARGALAMERGVRWRTADGAAPDDGSERCTLQPLADALHADCRTALVALSALLLAVAVCALAGLAVYCRRRAEQEYRARLAELDMRTISLKPGGLDRWEVPRERVVINRKLGTGAFGTVYGGHALLSEERGWAAVAVKTLKAGATTEEKLDFLSEAEAMKRFDHKNIVRLLGVVTKTEPVCTVMEFMLYGDLKNYLLARRHLAGAEGGEGAEEVSPRRLTAMALDAARALSYLAQLRYVHRDVAARNCLVSAHRQVKLADFGMTRLVFENDYYRFSRKGMLPVRWMAPESLTLGVFSPASDVWSFGVLLYEIVTFGSLPFQGLSNSEVLARVKAGRTLELPSGLKPQLEGLIKSCWQQEHKARPCAAEVAAFLADCPRLLAPCLAGPPDALPLDEPPWRLPTDITEARWVSWTAPASAGTDTTYLSADGDAPPQDCDAFLP